jgi:hypothetical protein
MSHCLLPLKSTGIAVLMLMATAAHPEPHRSYTSGHFALIIYGEASPFLKTFSAGGIDWRCQGTRCEGTGSPKSMHVDLCRAVASQVGAVRSFTANNQPMDASRLAKCNAGRAVAAKPLAQPRPGPSIKPARSAVPQDLRSARPAASASKPTHKALP